MILIFVASLNENMSLAKKIEKKLKKENKKTEIINLVELDIPMYDSKKEQNDGIPNKILDLKKRMEESQAYVVVSPEYNFSLPPVLVNTIAWLSRIGDDFRVLFSLKKIQLATHSGSNGQDVLNAMRNQFTRLGAVVAPREILTTYQKSIKEDSLERILKQYLTLVGK